MFGFNIVYAHLSFSHFLLFLFSLQQTRILRHRLVIVRLERQPHLAWIPAFPVRLFGRRRVDVRLLPPGARGRGVGQHLRVTAAVERNEEERGLVHGGAAGDDAMVAQDDAAVLGAEGLGDAGAFLCGEDCAAVVIIHWDFRLVNSS